MQGCMKTVERCVPFESEVERVLKSDEDRYYVPGIDIKNRSLPHMDKWRDVII